MSVVPRQCIRLHGPICQAVSNQQKHCCDGSSSLFTRFVWSHKFLTVKSRSKGTHFTSAEEVQAKTENLLKGLLKPSLQNCYQRWQHRMQKCVIAEGNYFEGDTATEN
ncbi:hypothetical protein TNCV_1256451 [Trichonephila clavipes]|nr:hypothetical protein TNCV_1256451 [Trichonephila clavipes]